MLKEYDEVVDEDEKQNDDEEVDEDLEEDEPPTTINKSAVKVNDPNFYLWQDVCTHFSCIEGEEIIIIACPFKYCA